jgi:hypothetical protein
VHTRLTRYRGRAADHLCVCGKQAHDWALIGEGELIDPKNGSYTTDLDRYEPRCRACHHRMDIKALIPRMTITRRVVEILA